MDYKARFYSAYLNRFLQPDTLIPSPANPQSWNRYSYVGNSPINFSDPSGHMRIQEEDQRDRFSQSVADKYVPKPRPLRPLRPPRDDEITLPATVTPTQANTPTVTPTHCPQVLQVCVPTSTAIPSPMATPTPYTGPYYTTPEPPSPYLDWNFSWVGPENVDWIDAGIDVVGLIGNGVEVGAMKLGAPQVAAGAWVVGTIVEGIGFIKSAIELDLKGMIVDQTFRSAEKTITLSSRFGRMAPGVGLAGNIVSLYMNFRPQVSPEWVTYDN